MRVVIQRSGEFFMAAHKLSATELTRAQARLEDAIKTQSEDDWEGATVIAKAEENCENCEAEEANNLLRVEWEAKEEWGRTPKPDRPMPTPWLHDPFRWQDIFVHYKMKLKRI